MPEIQDKMEKLISLCKRRGYIFQSSEIYGGINSCYDYGPLGAELKRNLKDLWWRAMTRGRDDIEGLDSSILMHPRIWEASGHVANFTDPLIDCKRCKSRFKGTDFSEKKCPKCGGELMQPRLFNLMFKTFMGPVEDSASTIYLRPETAQGIYVNFLNVQSCARRKIPFGIAQIGKAFRNEITPGNFTYRTREFEQMEMQYFVKPGTDMNVFNQWKEIRFNWHCSLGIKKENLRFHEHGPKELAHYAKCAFDIEYNFPFGWCEIEGIHNRTDYDLKAHMEFSGKKLSYFDEEIKERFIPYIIETSVGCDRTLLVLLVDSYDEEEERVVLRLHPKIAPMKCAVFPLINKPELIETAQKIYNDLRVNYNTFYDQSGAIGRRYRRQDEIGTPFCITVDNDTLTHQTVTIRERDTMKQERIAITNIREYLAKSL